MKQEEQKKNVSIKQLCALINDYVLNIGVNKAMSNREIKCIEIITEIVGPPALDKFPIRKACFAVAVAAFKLGRGMTLIELGQPLPTEPKLEAEAETEVKAGQEKVN